MPWPESLAEKPLFGRGWQNLARPTVLILKECQIGEGGNQRRRRRNRCGIRAKTG